MGGVFINYRRGDHSKTVEDLDAELARHFDRDQVFLDQPSLLPGQRFSDKLRERVDDCEVLLAVIHPGWADVRNAAGLRRLDDPDDWVRREIEQALEGRKVVVPVFLDGVTAPRPEELPASIRELVAFNGQPLRRAHWASDIAELIAALEGELRRTWEPVPAPEERGMRPGRWLGVLTAVLACATLAGVPAVPQDDSWVGTDALPYTLSMALASCLLLCAPLAAVSVVRFVRRSVDELERDLQEVRHRTYLRKTWPIGFGFVFIGVAYAFMTWGDQGMAPTLALLLLLAVAVVRAAVADLRLKKRDEDLWARWPHRLPERVSRVVLRRAVSRLHVRLERMTAPISLQQREKAVWELDDIAGAVGRVSDEAGRPRREWLSADHPWLFAGYALWLALTAALLLASGLAYADVGEGTVRLYGALGVVALIGVGMVLGTLEIAYRYQRRQRGELALQITGLRDDLVGRVDEMSRPARTKPTAPALRPEEYAEPD